MATYKQRMMTTTGPHGPKTTRHWFGYLTLENAADVADRIDEMLRGKRYTWVAVNENLDLLRPEVRASNRLRPDHSTNGMAVTLHEEDGHAHITVVDSYGVWGIGTSCPDQKVAHAKITENGAVGLHHMSDPELERRGDFDLVYLSWEHDDLLRIQQRTGAGGRVAWVIAVEDDRA